MIWPFSIIEKRNERIISEIEEEFRRDFLTRKQIEALPIKYVTRDESMELLGDPKLVVPVYYMDLNLKPLKNEVGYKKEARYVVEE